MEQFVKEKFPNFYLIWSALPKMIMKADIFRYLLMYDMGGMYFDLDYEMLRPYDFSGKRLVLPKERSISYGDSVEAIGNCVFASVPRHIFWNDVIENLKANPPWVDSYVDVGNATGPAFLTKIYNTNRDGYADITVPERINFHPLRPHSKREYRQLIANSDVYGIHHGWGSWKERLTAVYFKRKTQKIKKSILSKTN